MPRDKAILKEQISELSKKELKDIVLKLAGKRFNYEFLLVNFLDKDTGELTLFEEAKEDIEKLCEKEYKGKGISYCATCDAKYFVDQDVVVIGGGNSAVEEALFITKFARKVTVVHRSEKLKANELAVENLLAHPKIEVVYDHQPHKFEKHGDKMVTTIGHRKTKELSTIVSDGVFVFIGMQSNIEVFGDTLLKSDQWGYIVTDEDMKTSISDVYAIGDITSKKYRQITTAVADGTIAAISISKEL